MKWLAISDGRNTLRRPRPRGHGSAGLLTRGSLHIETLIPSEPIDEHVVLNVERRAEWPRVIRVTLDAAGRLRVLHRQDRSLCVAELKIPHGDRDATIRIAYAWDAPARRGRLSVQNLDNGRVDEVRIDNPLPMPLDDVAACVTAGAHRAIDPAIAMIAFADAPTSIGLSPGLVAGTPVKTPGGLRPVDALQPGDLVETDGAGLQPVRLVDTREWPAVGQFLPVALRAPYFGLREDIRLAPSHRVMISGVDAEYLFGNDAVLAEARFLALHAGARVRRRTPTLRYTRLVFDRHVCVNAAGAWCESLYLGDPQTRRALRAELPDAATAFDPLPVHSEAAGPELRPFEAMVLVSALCA